MMGRLVRMLLLAGTAVLTLGARGDPQAPAAPAPAPPSPVAAPAGPAGAQAQDIQDFVPSEHVNADDAVAFPADI
jgi:hypothetical protein